MGYSADSEWNEANELRCLVIFKRLQAEGFPRGRQAELCRQMAAITRLDWTNISAKVTNLKSVAGVIGESNASRNTREIYARYGLLSIPELEALLP